jgi:porphobilinogen synthase
MPYFVSEGAGLRESIASMPGIDRVSIDVLVRDIEKAYQTGLRNVLLFGVPGNACKDPYAKAAASDHALVPQAVRALRAVFGRDLWISTDVCLCPYTDHGHCGFVQNGVVQNDASFDALVAMALAHADAGADMVAPSDMMDGRVGAIRKALEERSLYDVGIMAYSVKYASAFYGPFRDAAHSAPGMGDRKSYQMDPRCSRDALREARLDEAEGADIIMVKPALAYLDVIRAVREAVSVPVACYNVSAEYSMLKAAAAQGWVDERAVVLESLIAMKRAGADIIISYHTRDLLAAGWGDL